MSHLRTGNPEEYEALTINGWTRPKNKMSSGYSMLYRLNGNEEDRLKRTTGNWRHNLKRSARYGLHIEEWVKPDISQISALYREMEFFKTLPTQYTQIELEAMFKFLKKNIIIYRCINKEGKLLAIRAAGVFGDTALDLLAVAGSEARKVYASHATLWALLDHCNKIGNTFYDLSGVDPIHNKGVFDFKHGTGADLVECLGEWESASIPGGCALINWIIGRKSQSA
jgi:lipid II:glycine glycyltransferase (peptidoglycan interpeptide bridge formation enzyme)